MVIFCETSAEVTIKERKGKEESLELTRKYLFLMNWHFWNFKYFFLSWIVVKISKSIFWILKTDTLIRIKHYVCTICMLLCECVHTYTHTSLFSFYCNKIMTLLQALRPDPCSRHDEEGYDEERGCFSASTVVSDALSVVTGDLGALESSLEQESDLGCSLQLYWVYMARFW